jgi:GNAT superfamily N-acetyltransferase
MYKIHHVNEVQPIIKELRDLKKGFITNYYSDPVKTGLWAESGLFFAELFHETVFFFRKDSGFYHVYYCATSTENLCAGLSLLLQNSPGIRYTIDVIGNNRDANETGGVIEQAGFFPYTRLVRMSRIIGVSDGRDVEKNPYLAEAMPNDAPEITGLLQYYFDPLAENLPLVPEIESWIKAGQIIVFREAEIIEGFLIYEIIGVTSYLRYWFVHPDYREKKIGSVLIQEFFKRCSGTKRQLFWVIQSNENAIKRYIHYGFLPENLVDIIYTNTNIQYGGDNH